MIHPAGPIEKPNAGPLQTVREGQEGAGRSQGGTRVGGSGRYGRPVLPDSLSVSRRGPVTLLQLSRPAKRNALDEATISGIESFFSDPPVRRAPSSFTERESIFRLARIFRHPWRTTQWPGFAIHAPGTAHSTGSRIVVCR